MHIIESNKKSRSFIDFSLYIYKKNKKNYNSNFQGSLNNHNNLQRKKLKEDSDWHVDR